MPGGYYGGLLEGFMGRREQNITRQQEQDEKRRQQEGRVYEYLLKSNDPEIQRLAMAGLFESARPGKRKKGLSGFLGEVEQGEILPILQQYMDEPMPVETGGPSPPAPGSAAMSANIPVQPGSQPINAAPGGMATPPVDPEASMEPGSEMLGAPPPGLLEGALPAPVSQSVMGTPPSTFKRRGTGVPTAEEIAEMHARVPLQTRIGIAEQHLPPELADEATMGILGAPRRAASFGGVSFGVKLPGSDKVIPVTRDNRTGQYMMMGPAGQMVPVPPDAEMVRMSGGATGGLTSTIRDSPAIREEYGIEPGEVTPSGYWKIKQLPDGTAMIMPSEYTPPPAYSGTIETTDPNLPTVPVRGGVPRGGGAPEIIGDVPGEEAPQIQKDAEALLALVDKRIQDERRPGLPVRPGRRDAVTAEEARKLGLPFTTYTEATKAAKGTAPITPRQKAEGGTMAERIRNRVLRNRAGGSAGTPPPPR